MKLSKKDAFAYEAHISSQNLTYLVKKLWLTDERYKIAQDDRTDHHGDMEHPKLRFDTTPQPVIPITEDYLYDNELRGPDARIGECVTYIPIRVTLTQSASTKLHLTKLYLSCFACK